MAEEIYLEKNGEYLKNNPTWHTEDSPWKAIQIFKMIERNHLQPKVIFDLGCGAGEVLNQLYALLPGNIHFTGYDISDDALLLCRQRAKDRLEFKKQSLFEIDTRSDLMLLIDVFEHIEDYYGFIKAAKEKSEYKIFHIPLEITVLNVLRNNHIYGRNQYGHLHHFSRDSALSTLQNCGLEIVDYFYTPVYRAASNKLTFKSAILRISGSILNVINNDFSVRLLGGASLMVLTK
jgi:SAM-dependent methyltransferase